MEALQVYRCCRFGGTARVETLQVWRHCRCIDAAGLEALHVSAGVEALRLSLKHCGVADKQQQMGSKPCSA